MASNVSTVTATATAKTPLLHSNSRWHSSSRLCVSPNNFNSFSTHSNSSYHSNLRLTTSHPLHHRRPLVLLRNPIPHSSHSQSPFHSQSHYHSHPQSQSQSNSSSSSSSSSSAFEQWDSLTAKFAGASNIPFLLLQLPQIILNARNLLAGNNSALFAVPWLGMLTGVLGNLSLLSYFAKKREKEVIVVQTLGVVSQYIVFSQLAIAGAMPFSFFLITSAVVSAGLLVNFLNYFYLLKPSLWLLWEDFITIAGLSALPQVMWSTFVPYLPNTVLPGAFAFLAALTAVIMARTGKLSEKGTKFVGAISGWTATLLFMWMPVSQMWTNFLNPNNIKGLSAFSMLLAMIGNGLMIPRALLIRDFMWFLGSSWASLFYGYGNIVCLYWFNSISSEFFLAASAGLFLWIGMALWRDTVVYGHSSPLTSLRELVFGAQV